MSLGHDKVEAISSLDKRCFDKVVMTKHSRPLGSEKVKIRTVDEKFAHLCFKRARREVVRAEWGQRSRGFYSVLDLQHIYVPMGIIQ